MAKTKKKDKIITLVFMLKITVDEGDLFRLQALDKLTETGAAFLCGGLVERCEMAVHVVWGVETHMFFDGDAWLAIDQLGDEGLNVRPVDAKVFDGNLDEWARHYKNHGWEINPPKSPSRSKRSKKAKKKASDRTFSPECDLCGDATNKTRMLFGVEIPICKECDDAIKRLADDSDKLNEFVSTKRVEKILDKLRKKFGQKTKKKAAKKKAKKKACKKRPPPKKRGACKRCNKRRVLHRERITRLWVCGECIKKGGL